MTTSPELSTRKTEEMNAILTESYAMGITVDMIRAKAKRLESIVSSVDPQVPTLDPEANERNVAAIAAVAEHLTALARRLEVLRSVSIVKANEALYLIREERDHYEQESGARAHSKEAVYLHQALKALV